MASKIACCVLFTLCWNLSNPTPLATPVTLPARREKQEAEATAAAAQAQMAAEVAAAQADADTVKRAARVEAEKAAVASDSKMKEYVAQFRDQVRWCGQRGAAWDGAEGRGARAPWMCVCGSYWPGVCWGPRLAPWDQLCCCAPVPRPCSQTCTTCHHL
jgi:hypothetical protein